MAHEATGIPLLTHELLERIRKAADGPGRVARAWMMLTRMMQERLQGALGGNGGARRLYGNATHYLSLELARGGMVTIEFGTKKALGDATPIGRLDARWDEVGLTGPYHVILRDRTDTLNTFSAVLEDYLGLPPAGREPHKAR